MNKFLTSNEWQYRLLRTIVQGICGVLVSYMDVLVASLTIPDTLRPIIVALCMAVLSPIMAEIGRATDKPVVEDIIVPYNPDDEVKHD